MVALTARVLPPPGGSASRSAWIVLWLNVIASTCLIATEVIAIFASFDWAISGLLGLSPSVTIGLGGLFFIVGVAIIWAFARQSLATERVLAFGGDL